ncbi:N/A [soil metagenome]
MEPDQGKKLKVGAFIVGGFIIFVIAIFIIGSKQNLFTSTFEINSIFESVSGLTEGATVNFGGIKVGTVSGISIESSTKIRVIMTINSNVKEYIRKDSKVSISSEGLVGNKIVEISSGSPMFLSVDNGEYLASTKPISAEDIFKALKESGDNAKVITGKMSDMIDSINGGKGTIGQLLTNESLYRNIDSTFAGFASSTKNVNNILFKVSSSVDLLTNDFRNLSSSIDNVTKNISEITDKLNSSRSLVGTLLTDTNVAVGIKNTISNITSTSQNLERATFGFYQNMEALKHNFLFKGYFEDIGYWDKADVERQMNDIEQQLIFKMNELKKREAELLELNNKINGIKGDSTKTK